MYVVRILNVILMICVPIGLAAYVNQKFESNWHLWWIGGTVFILSQVGHIPFNYLTSLILNRTNMVYWPRVYQTIFNALFLGLSAGLWEEFARYSAFRWWVRKARNWKKGVQLGIGHGSIESVLLGLLVLYTFIQMVAVKDIDLRNLVPPDQLSQTIGSISIYWALPWYDALLGGVERLLTLPIQIALSVLVVQVFVQKEIRWIWIAILFHTVVDATAVLFMSFSNIYITELAIAFFSLVSIWVIFALKTTKSIGEVDPGEENSSNPEIKYDEKEKFLKIHKIEETLENLDATKFQ